MTFVRRGLPVALVAVALAGCTSSGAPREDDPVISVPATTSAVPSSVVPPSVPVPSSSSVVASTAAATTSHVPSAVVSSSSARPVLRSTCTRLTIRIVPGGASVGQEIAALQFTNDSDSTCRLVGYPVAVLLRGGKPIGRPSLQSTTATSLRSLAPGETVESLLHDYVANCQAPLSDTVRVTAPGLTKSGSRPLQLRACLLRVDALGTPD